MSKPVIGITAGFSSDGDIFLRNQYCAAIEAAGGIPIILAPLKSEGDIEACASELLSRCDGLLLSGGGDVEPWRYGMNEYDSSILFEPSAARDITEIALAKIAAERDIPLLAICRGIQVLNVALGGDLHFDIPNHRQTLPRHETSHTVNVVSDSLLAKLTGCTKFEVNSFHHQAVKIPALGLEVTAVSEDGIIEALEAKDNRFILGVQWHPEHLASNNAAPSVYKLSSEIFNAFISACNI
ncbi:MAG: gamma-glutamyl-gamma-aminobutyrate hydrolase family protein [Clostridiales bacterium]|nr:gamma-glutamyl-gamma-aminobutyrate hydrolase family protein [Clostridiales bacterium]